MSIRAGVATGGWGGSLANSRFHGAVDGDGRVTGQLDTQDNSSGRTSTAPLAGAISGEQLTLTGVYDKSGRRITVELKRGTP